MIQLNKTKMFGNMQNNATINYWHNGECLRLFKMQPWQTKHYLIATTYNEIRVKCLDATLKCEHNEECMRLFKMQPLNIAWMLQL
jgi:hypothetical protein